MFKLRYNWKKNGIRKMHLCPNTEMYYETKKKKKDNNNK